MMGQNSQFSLPVDWRHSTRVAIVALLVIAGAIGMGLLIGPSTAVNAQNVSEEAYVEMAPEPGDPYFEAEDDDGEWISYENPRDEFRSPYLGEGSGKICISVRNEAGEPILGSSIPNTTVTIPTGESLDWHSGAGPMIVGFPLHEQYERPLDADQFGTTPDRPQGDGYMDSHCIEFHGMAANSTVSYGEASITGEYADRLTVVGYVEQTHAAWDSDIDPFAAARSYDNITGGWTYGPDESHGQVVIVLQLDPAVTDPGGGGEDETGTEERHSRTNDSHSEVETETVDQETTVNTPAETSTGDETAGEANRPDTTDFESRLRGALSWRWGLLALAGLFAIATLADQFRRP